MTNSTVPREVSMNMPIIQLLVLAGIAIFLILRLKSVLGTRDGFEKPPETKAVDTGPRRDFEVIEGGPDHDIVDHVDAGSPSADALARMKRADPDFSVSDFLSGARGAYEMILMGFERGEMAEIRPYLSEEVYEVFAQVVEQRHAQGLTIEAEFVGIRELGLEEATFDDENQLAEISVRFVAELIYAVRDASGDIVEGNTSTPKSQRDVWTFARRMGTNDPNWHLVATDE